MKNIILLFAMLFLFSLSFESEAKSQVENRIKVAVIDTGIYYHMKNMKFMCKDGIKDFTGKGKYDIHGHGSNIIGIISEGLNPKTHCIVSLKYYHNGSESGTETINSYMKAFKYLLEDPKIRYVNISGGGANYSVLEKLILKRLLTRGVNFVVAAGNEKSNLDTQMGKFYPASYRDEYKNSNFFVVASSLPSSNYGSIVTDRFSGDNIGPEKIRGVAKLSGTSQAAAQKMASLLKKLRRNNDSVFTGHRRTKTCR